MIGADQRRVPAPENFFDECLARARTWLTCASLHEDFLDVCRMAQTETGACSSELAIAGKALSARGPG